MSTLPKKNARLGEIRLNQLGPGANLRVTLARTGAIELGFNAELLILWLEKKAPRLKPRCLDPEVEIETTVL
jgi:hypothetical protein